MIFFYFIYLIFPYINKLNVMFIIMWKKYLEIYVLFIISL